MVKVPTSSRPVSPEYVEKRTQFLHDYGAFMALWSEFELTIEVKIAKLAGLSPPIASIILGGLSFGNKPAILYSLLERSSQSDAASTVRAVINHARRNALVHGLTGGDQAELSFAFFKREIVNSHVVKHLVFTAETFTEHFEEFRRLHKAACEALDITYDDLDRYGREAGLFEPTPARPQARHPRATSD